MNDLYASHEEFEELIESAPGCAKRCEGQSRCAVGWMDGSCGAKPQGVKWPDPNAGIKEIAGRCATTADNSVPSTGSTIERP